MNKWARQLTKLEQGSQEVWYVHGELLRGGQEAGVVARVLPVQQARGVLAVDAAAVPQPRRLTPALCSAARAPVIGAQCLSPTALLRRCCAVITGLHYSRMHGSLPGTSR